MLAWREQETVDHLARLGAKEIKTARALASESEVVILCVTGSPQVEEIVNGPEDLASASKPTLVIDCSPSHPSVTLRPAETLAKRNITLIDAPLARTPKEASDGTLDVMIGRPADIVARAKLILEAFARRVVHTGPSAARIQ